MASNNPQNPADGANKSLANKMIQPNGTSAQQQKEVLERYWNHQREKIAGLTEGDLKKHEIPLSRIKKIMKSDKDVRMVATETPILLAKAAEFFIQELTIKSWLKAEHIGRRTLRKDDIVEVINEADDYYDFLFDFVREKQAAGGGSSSVTVAIPHADPGFSFYSGPLLTTVNGVLMLIPSAQRWIRYGNDQVEMKNGEEVKNGDDGVDGAAQ